MDLIFRLCFLCVVSNVACVVNATIYNIAENMAIESSSSPLSETVCVSVRHCSLLCTINTECTSASYDPHTGNCQLMGNNTWTTIQDGRKAITLPGTYTKRK